MLRDLNLGYPTWISHLSQVVKTVMPLLGDNQVFVLHAFVRLKKTLYQSNNVGSRLEIISRVGKFVALVHVNNIMPREPQAHLLIESVYATQDPKQVSGTLMGSQLIVDQIVSGCLQECHSSFYESDHRDDNLPFLPMCDYLVWSTILQGYSLQNVVLSPKTFHTSIRIYQVLKPIHLIELKGKR